MDLGLDSDGFRAVEAIENQICQLGRKVAILNKILIKEINDFDDWRECGKIIICTKSAFVHAPKALLVHEIKFEEGRRIDDFSLVLKTTEIRLFAFAVLCNIKYHDIYIYIYILCSGIKA